ncbi:hypothetical protein CPB83DRAFT_885427 [Crepidotus variabilis]|uniref:Uncharacterized protein n=1 Tax=Crepidotus variabilis TaxID=179855 RepID=A0A9P6JLU7_9AGAR|nr:hypothetical protein CPB83DRAFT_885427 [Crepidotus variabilis]
MSSITLPPELLELVVDSIDPKLPEGHKALCKCLQLSKLFYLRSRSQLFSHVVNNIEVEDQDVIAILSLLAKPDTLRLMIGNVRAIPPEFLNIWKIRELQLVDVVVQDENDDLPIGLAPNDSPISRHLEFPVWEQEDPSDANNHMVVGAEAIACRKSFYDNVPTSLVRISVVILFLTIDANQQVGFGKDTVWQTLGDCLVEERFNTVDTIEVSFIWMDDQTCRCGSNEIHSAVKNIQFSFVKNNQSEQKC